MTSRGQFLGNPSAVQSYVNGIPIVKPIDTVKVNIVSDAAWCNINDPETNAPHQTGHAFDANDPNRQHMTKTQTVQVPTGNSYGQTMYQQRQEITETLDICGYHWGRQNPFQTEAIEGPKEKTSEDSKTLDELEDENNEWQAGYEAGIEHALRSKRTT